MTFLSFFLSTLTSHKWKKSRQITIQHCKRQCRCRSNCKTKIGSMWNYLRKYRNNHAKNSQPSQSYSNASTDTRIWKSGPATFNPLNWYSCKFALGHHLFTKKTSPIWPERSETIFPPPQSRKRTSIHRYTNHPSPIHATLHPTGTYYPDPETLSR